MSNHLNREITTEIRRATTNLSPYDDGPGVDYTHAEVAYVANITLLHDPAMRREDHHLYTPGPETHALIVRRGKGGDEQHAESGVSGYVDTAYDPHDPHDPLSDDDFDPIAYTVRNELAEECTMLPDDIDRLILHLGQRFVETRPDGRILHVLPLVGICVGAERPSIKPDGIELTNFAWVPLGEVGQRPNVSPSYLTHTLPRALGALGLHAKTIQSLLKVNPKQ